jgi:subtilisin family serine protease
MQGSAAQKKSTSKHLAFGFSFLCLFALLTVVYLSPISSATPQTSKPNASEKKSRPAFVPGQVLVRYRNERTAQWQPRQMTLSAAGRELPLDIERLDTADIVDGLRLARVAAADTMDAIEALRQQPDVLYAEPNYLLYLDATPNDPRFTSNELYGLLKIGAPTAWDTIKGSTDTPTAGFGSPRIVVGVIDEGIDLNHQDLLANIWTNPGEIPGNGVDDDGNGFIDDVHGYDFALNSGNVTGQNHGTHVAGTIGAVGNNGTGVVGVNWSVGLMSLKFIDGLQSNTADAIRACSYAKQMRDLWVSTGGTRGANLRVLNNSYGSSTFSQSFLDTINALNQSNILFVAAAGNVEGFDLEPNNDLVPHYPASYAVANVIGVASTGQTDNLASDSHFGAQSVHMGAPGVGILSTTIGNTYSVMGGTSMASPHVAGAAALLLAKNPNLTIQQLKGLLIYNGDVVSSLAGKTITGRRLNIASSMQALNDNDVTPPGTVTNFHINTQNGRSLNVGWTASGDDGAAGNASLYTLEFTDATTGAVTFFSNIIPAASGVTQAIDIKIPYRHTSGTLRLREFDNAGNEGTPATTPVTVSLVEADPYVTSIGSSVALSTGGTPLNLKADDKLQLDYTLPFTFPFFGENFTKVNISTNGSLFLSAPPIRSGTTNEPDDVPSSLKKLVRYKMISGMWDDLRTDKNVSDDVYVVTPDASRIIFRWQGVNFGFELPINFEIELRSNGTILTRYGTGQSAPTNTKLLPVVGISAGEPDPYVILSHTSTDTFLSLTNAPEVTFLPRSLSVNSSVQFQVPQFNVVENGQTATLTVTRSGDTSTGASVDYATADGSATQKGDYQVVFGRVNFSAGETSKTFTVSIVDDSFQEGTESFSVTLSNPIGTTLGARTVAQVLVLDDDLSTGSNPLDNANALFFVRQHYLDFLNREPDPGGLAFWANQITSCGSDAQCIEIRRINVSAAFFLSIEFQETGYLAYKMYKTSFGNLPGAPVPVRYEEFMPDTQQLSNGVVIGQPDAQQKLEANKVAFSLDFVNRTRFATAYPTTLTPTQFVNALIANAGFTPTPSERAAFISQFGSAADTVDTQVRARVVRGIAENGTFSAQEKNGAFVLMQYFGYLRRNPYDPPESTLDYQGYNFWLGKLNQFNGNFVNADMVKAFIISGEYRHRFGP